jgi:hypothetical protein
MEFVNLKAISIKNSPTINEAMIQEMIANDPKILGLGDLEVRDKERTQPHAGRLDLLLQDNETKRRFEVEIQLGKTDESHIIRTIEYWDIEKKRFPQYDHCAVIVAEDITSRFLNVIQLFNGNIPIIAIQMKAYEVSGKIALIFSKIIDEINLGFEEDDDDAEVTDRGYWEKRGTKEILKLADEAEKLIQKIDANIKLTYKKHYIGLSKSGQAFNFAIFRAKKANLRMELRLEKTIEIEEMLEQSDLDVMDYDARDRRYRVRIVGDDFKKNSELLEKILRAAHDNWK